MIPGHKAPSGHHRPSARAGSWRNASSPRRTAGSPRPSGCGAAWPPGSQPSGAAVAFEAVLVAIDEHHHVGVLLDRAGVAGPTVAAACRSAARRRAERARRQHRHVEFLGERLQSARDLGERPDSILLSSRPCTLYAWCTTDAPRSPAPSMPVRKYYSARRRRFALDRTEQCCGVSLPTFTNRGSASWPPPRPSLDTPGRRPVFRPPRFSQQG